VGNRLRVNAQLINAATDAHVWAETFDREVTDLFALQSELAERITLALRANLSPREKASLRIHSTSNLEAYENYLRARDLFRWSGAGDPHENGERALRCLERATELDPNFALAYTLASRWHGELFWFGFDRSEERLRKVKETAETALRLQPELGPAHLALAYYYYLGFRDYEHAREKAEQAQRYTPNDADVYNILATMSRRQGRWNESLATFDKGLELDPRNVSLMWDLAETCVAAGRYDEAERAITQALAINPEAHLFRLLRGTIALRGRGETAPLRAALAEIPREFDPGGSVTLVAVRVGLMERDPAAAQHSLGNFPHERYNDTGVGGIAGTLDGYSFPAAWLRGLIARARGDIATARREFEAALDRVEHDINCCSAEAKTRMMYAMVHAALGKREEAIRHGEAAAADLPIERDAYDGPVLATNLAAVYAQLGEKERALDLLGKIRGVPMAATPGTLRAEREWDALRDDGRFRALIS
jgi:tetratricopeptide (TPR) repeat protein